MNVRVAVAVGSWVTVGSGDAGVGVDVGGSGVNVHVAVAVTVGGMGVEVGVCVDRGVAGSLGAGEWVAVGVVLGGGALVDPAGCAAMIDVAEGAVEGAAPGVRQPLTSSPSRTSVLRIFLTLLAISPSPCWPACC